MTPEQINLLTAAMETMGQTLDHLVTEMDVNELPTDVMEALSDYNEAGTNLTATIQRYIA